MTYRIYHWFFCGAQPVPEAYQTEEDKIRPNPKQAEGWRRSGNDYPQRNHDMLLDGCHAGCLKLNFSMCAKYSINNKKEKKKTKHEAD